MFGFFKRKQKELRITAACGCNIGRVRSNNEDNLCFNGTILPADNRGLDDPLCFSAAIAGPVHFGVFDGMGGEAYGELAAYIAAAVVRDLPKSASAKELISALRCANVKICEDARKRNSGMMGTTAVVLTIDSGVAYIANIGDSKGYQLRAGEIRQLSTDHTEKKMLEQCGIKGRKPRLTQHLGIEPTEMLIEPAIWKGDVHTGDCFILCSDGLSDMLTEEEIADIVSANESPGDCVNVLIGQALEKGGRDNVTVIVIKAF